MDIVPIEKLLEEAYSRHVATVINYLKGLGRNHMHSGEDSPFQNVWEEFATQVQGEESLFWGLYQDMVRGLCAECVYTMSPTEIQLLWLFTEEGEDWNRDIEYGFNRASDTPPFDPRDVERAIYQKVYSIALNVPLPSEASELDEEDDIDL